MATSSLTNFVNSVSLEKEEINATNVGHPTVIWREASSGSVVHDREGELGQHHQGRDRVSVCPAVLCLCALASLSLLFDLKRLFHRSTDLLLQAVVVVGKVLALDLGRALFQWASSVVSLPSRAAASLCQAMTADALAGDQWTSGPALWSDSPSRGQPCQIVATVLRCRLEYPR